MTNQRTATRLTAQKTQYASTMESIDFSDLVRESGDIWNQNANWWDARMGEGNDWHRSLIASAVERLLEAQPCERVLELACGNGQLASRLASIGAEVALTVIGGRSDAGRASHNWHCLALLRLEPFPGRDPA